MHESIAGKWCDPETWRRWNAVEPLVELSEQMAEPPKGKWRRGDRTHHRRTFESVHDEEAFACVVDVGARISVRRTYRMISASATSERPSRATRITLPGPCS